MGLPLKAFRKKDMPKNIISDLLFREEKEEKIRKKIEKRRKKNSSTF